MKKFTKIISIVCVLAFVLSFTAFATFEDGTVVEYKLKADKASYNVGDEITVTVYTDDMAGDEIFAANWTYAEFKTDELEFVSDSTGAGKVVAKSAANTSGLVIEYEDGFNANWSALFTVTFKALKAGGLTLEFTDICVADEEYNSTSWDTVPSITFDVKAAGPVSVATTMTVKGTEYTDVPNATVENVNYVDGVITGALNIDYWKDGAAQPAQVIPAAKFVGMPANVNVTGTGTVSFTVALMGVPTDVTITGISFK